MKPGASVWKAGYLNFDQFSGTMTSTNTVTGI
jgi:hypothetical protein